MVMFGCVRVEITI